MRFSLCPFILSCLNLKSFIVSFFLFSQDSEFVEYLDKLRDSVKVKEILESDGPLSVSRIMNQYDKIINETAASNRDTSIDRPTQFHPLPVLNSLREVSSHMMAFQASPETRSAINAARQICYWLSL